MRTCLIDVDPGIGRVQSAKYAKSCHLPICIPSSDVGGQVGNTHRQTLALGHPKCAGGPRGRGARDPCNRTAIRRPRADAHPRSRAATANFSGREPFRACSISYNLLLRLGSPFVRGFLRTAHSRHSPEFLRLSTQPPPPLFSIRAHRFTAVWVFRSHLPVAPPRDTAQTDDDDPIAGG